MMLVRCDCGKEFTIQNRRLKTQEACARCSKGTVYNLDRHKLSLAKEVLEMVVDNTKMPHQHSDLQTRLYCLAERAREVLDKIK